MDTGWIKLYRNILEKPIWISSTLEQKVILITLLLLANHKENEWLWGGELYTCQPGQFITSLDAIASKSGVGQQSVRSAIKKFQKLKFLTNESTKTGRLITIIKWHRYQDDTFTPNNQPNRQLTKSQQRPNKDLTTNKNVRRKEYINNNIILDQKFSEFWEDYPRKIGKPKAEKTFKLIKETEIPDVLAGLARYNRYWLEKGTEMQFIPHPVTWLNQQRWNDELTPSKSFSPVVAGFRKPDLPPDWSPPEVKPANPEAIALARAKMEQLKSNLKMKQL